MNIHTLNLVGTNINLTGNPPEVIHKYRGIETDIMNNLSLVVDELNKNSNIELFYMLVPYSEKDVQKTQEYFNANTPERLEVIFLKAVKWDSRSRVMTCAPVVSIETTINHNWNDLIQYKNIEALRRDAFSRRLNGKCEKGDSYKKAWLDTQKELDSEELNNILDKQLKPISMKRIANVEVNNH